MPINKKALLRYQVLDRCFSNRRRRYNFNDLVEEVNKVLSEKFDTTVSERQIRDDISYMRDSVSYGAPITTYKYDGNKCYYRYSDSDFTIFNNQLTVDEVNNLSATIDMLRRYRGGNNGWLEEVISNLELRFGIKGNRENVVSFEQNSQLKGIENLSELIDCTINHQALNILYRTYSGKEITVVFHPYYIKQYNNRWFLFGLEQTPKGNRISNRPIDRIENFYFANVPFIPNTTTDFTTYFDDVVGVTIPEPSVGKETILLKFDAERFPYVVSKPIHRSQVIVSEDDCILQIQVRPNKELQAVIFSYTPQVEVLVPQWLRDDIKRKIAETLKKYESVKKDCTEKM